MPDNNDLNKTENNGTQNQSPPPPPPPQVIKAQSITENFTLKSNVTNDND